MSQSIIQAGPYVFFSYFSGDRGRVLPIARELEKVGVRVWIDLVSIPAGANYGLAIAEGIQHSAAMLLACSPEALQSRNVKQEIQLAWKHQRPYLPLLLEHTTFPQEIEYWLEGYQWVEILDRPRDEWLPKVIQALKKLGVPTSGEYAVAGLAAKLAQTEPILPAVPGVVELPRVVAPADPAPPTSTATVPVRDTPTAPKPRTGRLAWPAVAALVGIIVAIAALMVVAPWRGGNSALPLGVQPSGPATAAPALIDDGRGAATNGGVRPEPPTLVVAPNSAPSAPSAPTAAGQTPASPTRSVPVIPMGS